MNIGKINKILPRSQWLADENGKNGAFWILGDKISFFSTESGGSDVLNILLYTTEDPDAECNYAIPQLIEQQSLKERRFPTKTAEIQKPSSPTKTLPMLRVDPEIVSGNSSIRRCALMIHIRALIGVESY